jgi:hypothetical protein
MCKRDVRIEKQYENKKKKEKKKNEETKLAVFYYV